MSAPVIWVLLPALAGGFALLLPKKFVTAFGGLVAALLALTAAIFPIDTALLLGPFSIKIAAAVNLFGRSLVLHTADGALLVFVYVIASFWFFSAHVPSGEKSFVSLGLMILALLVASIAVEPFLYAALLVEIAAMLALPLLAPFYRPPGRGAARFLVYYTLAMPFILFSGWMLAGIESSPGDLNSTVSSGIMLGLGFAFLLGVFPLYHWIPLVVEESPPYAAGFLLWAFSSFTAVFALGFLDRYPWLHTSPQFSSAFLYAGMLMVVTAGIFASLQKHIGRMMGYAAVSEMGLIVLAMGLSSPQAVYLIFMLLIPRGVELVVWALALALLKQEAYPLRLGDVRGLARRYPLASAALVIAHLSMVGVPLLAGFPPRLALWQALSSYSLWISFWVFLGLLGQLAAASRTLAALVMADDAQPWQFREGWQKMVLLALGILGLFALGIFPQILQPFLASLPDLFERLTR